MQNKIYWIKDIIYGKRFIHAVFLISSYTIIGQLVTLATMPIISRLYDPSDFGIVATYSSIIAIFLAIASLRYDSAIPLPKQNAEAANLLILSIALVAFTGILFPLTLVSIGIDILDLTNLFFLKNYLWVLILGCFGAGAYQAVNYWAVRKRDYARIGKTKLIQGAGGATTNIAFGMMGFGHVGLMIGYVISQLAGVFILSSPNFKENIDSLEKVNISEIKKTALVYKKFPIYSCIASILNILALQIPTLLLIQIYGKEITGLYFMANSIIAMPPSLISGSISQAYLGEISLYLNEDRQYLKSMYLKTTKSLAVMSVTIVGSLAIIAPYAIPIILGNNWKDAGIYCLALSPGVIAGFITAPISNLNAYGFNHWQLVFDVVRTSLVILCFVLAYYIICPPELALALYSVILASLYIILIFLNIKAIEKID